MSSPPEQRPPLALAMEWFSRIFVVGLEMVLPGLGGGWLDKRFGTEPLLTLVGFGLGIAGGISHLLLMVAAAERRGEFSRNVSHPKLPPSSDPPRDPSARQDSDQESD